MTRQDDTETRLIENDFETRQDQDKAMVGISQHTHAKYQALTDTRSLTWSLFVDPLQVYYWVIGLRFKLI